MIKDEWREATLMMGQRLRGTDLTDDEIKWLAYMAVFDRMNFYGALDFLMYCNRISVGINNWLCDYVKECVANNPV